MLLQPSAPMVIALSQYSQVIIISPNFGEIGAPQLGHFTDLASKGATIFLGAAAETVLITATAFPHLRQNDASSGSCLPHDRQYI